MSQRFNLPRSAFLVAVLAHLPACDSPDASSGGDWTTTVDTLPGGTVHVVNTPPSETVGPTWVAVEDLRIGTRDGDGPAAFGRLKGLVVTRDGRIAVLDEFTQEVRVFGLDGTHLTTLGGFGDGPGEFQLAFGLMIDDDDVLWAPDWSNARMTTLDPETGPLETHPFTMWLMGFVWTGVMSDDGMIHKPSVTREEPRRRVMRVYDRQMVQVDSLFLPEWPISDRRNPPGSFYWEAPGGVPSGYQTIPFFPAGIEVGDRSGARWSRAMGDPSYRIARWIPGGDTTLVIETLRPPVAVPEAVRDSAIEVSRERLRERGGAKQDWSRVPGVWPAVQQIFPTQDGGLWVQVASPDSLRWFDVYEGDGTYAGTVATSLNIFSWIAPTIREDRIWAVVTDEFDVPYVVRARIEAPGLD